MLDVATLSAELEKMEPTDNEVDAINSFVSAFGIYFYGASVNGIPCTSGSLDPALNAMKTGLAGISATGAASLVIQSGISTFWSTVCGLAATLWVLVPPIISATPPPGLAGISAALNSSFVANTSGQLSLSASAAAIATALHATQLGGVAIQTGTPPISWPIL